VIDELIARMAALLEPLQAAGDQRQYFHATYQRTTIAVAQELKRGGFADTEWVERWDVAFADLYLDACWLPARSCSSSPPPASASGCRARDRGRTSGFGNVVPLLGVEFGHVATTTWLPADRAAGTAVLHMARGDGELAVSIPRGAGGGGCGAAIRPRESPIQAHG
jgi:Family of unknown function (DUF5995)